MTSPAPTRQDQILKSLKKAASETIIELSEDGAGTWSVLLDGVAAFNARRYDAALKWARTFQGRNGGKLYA